MIKQIIRIIIGVIFIISAWFKLTGIDSFEIYIYSFGILKLSSSFLFARFVISFELLLGVLLVLGVFSKKTIYTSLTMLKPYNLSERLWIYLLLKGESEHCHCFGDLIEMSHAQSIAKNLALVTLLLLSFNKSAKKRRFDKYILPVLVIISISLPFIISPPDSFSIEKYSSKTHYSKENLDKYLAEHENIKGRKVLCFFGVSCRFCKLSAKKISVISDKVGSTDLIEYVFMGDKDKVHDFFNETNTQIFSYSTIETAQFLRITDGRMPLILLMEDDSVINKYGYRDLSEQEILDFLNHK